MPKLLYNNMLSRSLLIALLLGLLILPALGQDQTQSGTTSSASPITGQSQGHDATANMSPEERSIFLHFRYVESMVVIAMSDYWDECGEMPDSVRSLCDGGLIPPNVVNPVTGARIIVENEEAMGPGDVFISPDSDRSVAFTVIYPAGNRETTAFTSAMYSTDEDIDPEDQNLHMYDSWLLYSMDAFLAEFRRVPADVEEISKAGYWPFKDEVKLLNGKPFNPDEAEWGYIYIDFQGERVTAWIFLNSGKLGSMEGPQSDLSEEPAPPR